MIMIAVHIAGGLLGVASGFIALGAPKGGRIHRRAGGVFMLTMLAMGGSAVLLALMKGQGFNVGQGALAAYLVATGYAAVGARSPVWRRFERGAPAVALGVALYDLYLMLGAAGPGHGLPRAFVGVFGAVALAAAVGDVRAARAGGLRGSRRLARHLWRMTFALFIACASLFLGQARILPPVLRAMPVRALPVLAVLLALGYWMWRVRRAGGTRRTTVQTM
jgi:hypothetical protein